MVAVAIYSADPTLRPRLEQLLRSELGYTVASVTNDPEAVSQLIEQRRVDTVVAHAPSRELLTKWRNRHPATMFVVIAGESDEGETLDALYAGATAILPPWAESNEVATAIDVAGRGLALLPRNILERLLHANSPASEESLLDDGASRVSLTPREHEVLTAMADGASNKLIARRLGISLHTAKFHVAAILAKLDADSRTEAVARAAHLGRFGGSLCANSGTPRSRRPCASCVRWRSACWRGSNLRVRQSPVASIVETSVRVASRSR
jgi:DNA-binding NarL/FixJ family response regulator